MNNEPVNEMDEDMLPEYDFSNAVRGKHVNEYRQGYRITVHRADGITEEYAPMLPEGAVILDPEVRRYFPDTESVNEALRGLIKLIPQEPSAERTR